MALAKVKLGSSGGKNKERWMTRAECKEGSSKRRRRADQALAGQEAAGTIGVLDFNEAELLDAGYVKVEPAK